MTRTEIGKKGYEKVETIFESTRDRQHEAAVARWIPTSCPHCENPIPYEKRGHKFCNRSCAASFNNRGVQHHKPHPINIEGGCLACGKPVGGSRKFCNNRCQADLAFKVRLNIVNTTGDLWQAYKKEGAIRGFLLKTRPHMCVICRGTEWMGRPTPLVMDHIDGNPENWSVDNVRLICPNCDAQTPTFSGKNRGNGRWARRERYARRRDGGSLKCNPR